MTDVYNDLRAKIADEFDIVAMTSCISKLPYVSLKNRRHMLTVKI
jgi:hypothetical protein